MLKKVESVLVPCFLCFIAIIFGCKSPVHASEPKKNSQYSSQGMDIVFLVDNSQTMWEKHFDNRQKDDPLSLRNNAMRAAVNVVVGSDVRVGFVYFADTDYKSYSLQHVGNETEYREVCRKYLNVVDPYPTNINTNIDSGLNGAMRRFDENSDKKKLIVLFTDGIDAVYPSFDTVEKLLEDDIELHCISINNEDNEELRQLVNYRQNSHEYDDRLTYVTPDNLHELYDKFIEKFFGFRGDVRYKKIELDSDYSYSFSVPELAVSKFQLYIRGTDISAELYKVSDFSMQEAELEELEEWDEFDHCIFKTVKNPGKSQYYLKLSSPEKENLDNATVILAYYTDLQADAVIEPVEDDDIIRGHDNRLKIQFFDGDKKTIAIDSKADVTAYADILKEDGTIVPKEIPVIEKNKLYCVSDSFTLDDFGELQIRLSVSFGKNIGIDYIFDTFGESDTKIKIVPHSPETIRKYSNDTINAEKIQNGSQKKFLFTIPLEEYIRDIDSPLEEMKVSDFRSYSDHNSFTAYAENERLVIEADNEGIINGFVELKDESGKKTKLDIEGNIKTMEDTDVFRIVLWVALGVLVFVILCVILWYKKKKSKITEPPETVEKGQDTEPPETVENVEVIERPETVDEGKDTEPPETVENVEVIERPEIVEKVEVIERPEIVEKVEEKLSVITSGYPSTDLTNVVFDSDIAIDVASIFDKINYDELKPKILDVFIRQALKTYKSRKKLGAVVKNLREINEKTGKVNAVDHQGTDNTSGISKQKLVKNVVDAITEVINKEKEQQINNVVENMIEKLLSFAPSNKEKQEMVYGIETVFAENIYSKHNQEIIDSIEERLSRIIDDVMEPIAFSIRIKDKKRDMSYRLAKPSIDEEHPWYRTLGDFESLSGFKVRDLPEKDRPDIEIRFESGRENGLPVVYVISGNAKRVVRPGDPLDWLDMKITLRE